ncbi:MAG TPA: M1 family aminopeptidase [Candidatus Sulfotelmatobacter sp.]
MNVTGERIQAHSSNWGATTYVTKVLSRGFVVAVLVACSFVCAAARVDSATAAKPGEALYRQLGEVTLDPARVYRVRDVSLDRSAIHITLDDGTIAFTRDVMGHVTGAFFEGEGEILLVPPNEAERKSSSLFTGMAIIEERFATAYFRFNDDTMAELQSGLRPAENAAEFASRWSETAKNLAHYDAMRLLLTFSRQLPPFASEREGEQPTGGGRSFDPADRVLHARLQGTKLGIFDVYYDSSTAEQVEAGQAKTGENGEQYYDVWTSFSPSSASPSSASKSSGEPGKAGQRVKDEKSGAAFQRSDMVAIRSFRISTDVTPPKRIQSEARLELEVKQGGARTLLFELSRFLRVESVQLNGQPVEFIHNLAMEGTELARRGNDLVAVILPSVATTGQMMELRFAYGGEVLAEAGAGLLYVGARGTWYPNRGLLMADFDLQFRYPAGWTLVATGKPAPVTEKVDSKSGQEQASHWISDRPIPVAGFNLGKYKLATARAGEVKVESYATGGVEKSFPTGLPRVTHPGAEIRGQAQKRMDVVTASNPSPASNEAMVAEAAAQAIRYYAARFGPFPYSHLALTQIPGRESQGWPGLIFLSSYAFLNNEDRAQLHEDAINIVLQEQIPAHEAAHQWWGDLVTWKSYRDQWFSEGLANYCSLMMVQEKNPAGFRLVMERYRRDLVEKNKDGLAAKDDGPVTLGTRLLSSKFAQGYEAISYGRSTWLFHMLRTMLQDGMLQERKTPETIGAEEPFVRALHKVRDRYQGKSITTEELFDVFAEDLPQALRYEGKRSLDWFVEGWVNGTALPKLELKAVKIIAKSQGMAVSGTITQKDAPPDLVISVPVYAVVSKRTPVFLGRVFADGEESAFRVAAPAGTQKILLDPKETILTAPK